MATTQYTRDDIDAKIAADLADNTTKDISAADVRTIVRDYITSSTYAPIMIYAGILKHDEGSSSADVSITDLYYNPDFFRPQLPTDPTNSSNPVQLSTTGVPGVADGDTTVSFGVSPYQLSVKFTVASNVITRMDVLKPGYGLSPGDTFTTTLGSTSLTITYNGVVTSNGSTGFNHRFILSTNVNQTNRDHRADNTIISATPKFHDTEIKVCANEITANNELYSRLDTNTSAYGEHYQHVQLYRIAV